MPAHLKKYQQGGYIPKHAEKAMSQHMQKSLPGRLKKYADPYLQQNVMWGNSATSSSSAPKPSSSYSPVAGRVSAGNTFDKQIFSSDSNQGSNEPSQASTNFTPQNNQQPEPQDGGNNYDFIMNSSGSGKSPLFAPENTKMRIAIFAAGIILLIILMSVFFSFLNSAGNKQKENLFNAAQTQTEIIRIIDLSDDNIADRNLKDKVMTLRATLITSQQETIAALSSRGQEAKPKELNASTNPQTDAALETALEQARYDEALDEIMLGLLNQYASELEAVYNDGNAGEQELATDAFNQIDQIYGLSSENEAESEPSQANQ